MKKLSFIISFLIIISSSTLFGQNTLLYKTHKNAELIYELAPANFKNYKNKLLVVPGFKAIGMTKFLTKRLDKYYMKPYHVADISEVEDGLGPENYSVDEFQYMIFVDKSLVPSMDGSREYRFYLVDRKNNIVYNKRSSNMFKKYLKKILK